MSRDHVDLDVGETMQTHCLCYNESSVLVNPHDGLPIRVIYDTLELDPVLLKAPQHIPITPV
jgi:hypothetical protein